MTQHGSGDNIGQREKN